MSWLRNHFRHFVLPGIHTLARHGHKGTLTAADIAPREKTIRPSTKCKYVEAGLLYSLVASVLQKGDPTREAALGLCRQIGRAKDAEFVYEVDARGMVKSLGKGYDGVEGSDVLHSMLCNSMRRLKRKMRKRGELLLPGRDVWCWEVMARKLTVQSIFDPRVSRGVASNQSALKICIGDWQIKDWEDVLFFDTGFSGSIPRAIARAQQLEQIRMLLLSSGDPKHQIFRTHTGSRKKALAFEYLAKYFQSGTTRDSKPFQQLNPLEEFIKASMLTIWLWYHVSPQRLPSYRDKKLPRPEKSKIQVTDDPTAMIHAPYVSLPQWHVVSSNTTTATTADITFGGTGTGTLTGAWSTDSASTLDSLWGAGTAGSLLIENGTKTAVQVPQAPPETILQSAMKEMQKEVDKEILNKLQDTFIPVKDPAKVPVAEIPGELMFEPPGAKTSKVKPYLLDPSTFKLIDPKTGQYAEQQLDAKALAVVKGEAEPTEEGFELGQYPGPPVVDAAQLKMIADMDPDEPGIPDIDLQIVAEPLGDNSGIQAMFKKMTLTKPDGTKKVYKTPITG